MPQSVDLRLASEAIHETLTAQRKQVTRIVAEDGALIARSRRAIDSSRELLGEPEPPESGGAARLDKLTLEPPRGSLNMTLSGPRPMDKETIRQNLVMAQHHVELGEKHIKRQREIVEELDSDQRSAWSLLKTFEEMQVTHVADRDRLRDLLDAS